jgi:multidrug resistance efflux pump
MKKYVAVCLILLSVLGLAGCGTKEKSKVSAVAKEEQQGVEAFGTIKATIVRDLVVDFSGNIKQVNVKAGQNVKKGDSLFVLDMSDYQLQISQKERQLKAEEYELQRLVNSTSGQQKDIKRLQNDLHLKQANLKNSSDSDIQKALSNLKYTQDLYNKALKDLSSEEALFKAGAISQTELDGTKKEVDAKNKAVEDAKYDVDILKAAKQKEVDGLQANIDQKLSNVDNLELSSDINLIKIQNEKIATIVEDIKQMKDKINKGYIKQNEIISDVDNGVVYDIGYVQGNRFDVSKKLLSILDLNSIVVQADVAEDFIKDVKLGADVVIIPQMDKTKEYKGKVTSISNKAIKKDGETDIPVEISIDNKDDFLVADSNVDVIIQLVK